MANRKAALAMAAALLMSVAAPAYADNQMGYRMLPSDQAAQLPRGGGSIGINVQSTQRITEQGLDFSVLTVTAINPGSPAAAGGLAHGDMIIAVNGIVFPGIREFAQYVGSLTPGSTMVVDFIPRGTAPDNAQRVTLRVGVPGQRQPRQEAAATEGEPATGMSTRMKLGLGAAALFGCYELGCFSHRTPTTQQIQQSQRPQGYQGQTNYPMQTYGNQQGGSQQGYQTR